MKGIILTSLLLINFIYLAEPQSIDALSSLMNSIPDLGNKTGSTDAVLASFNVALIKLIVQLLDQLTTKTTPVPIINPQPNPVTTPNEVPPTKQDGYPIKTTQKPETPIESGTTAGVVDLGDLNYQLINLLSGAFTKAQESTKENSNEETTDGIETEEPQEDVDNSAKEESSEDQENTTKTGGETTDSKESNESVPDSAQVKNTTETPNIIHVTNKPSEMSNEENESKNDTSIAASGSTVVIIDVPQAASENSESNKTEESEEVSKEETKPYGGFIVFTTENEVSDVPKDSTKQGSNEEQLDSKEETESVSSTETEKPGVESNEVKDSQTASEEVTSSSHSGTEVLETDVHIDDGPMLNRTSEVTEAAPVEESKEAEDTKTQTDESTQSPPESNEQPQNESENEPQTEAQSEAQTEGPTEAQNEHQTDAQTEPPKDPNNEVVNHETQPPAPIESNGKKPWQCDEENQMLPYPYDCHYYYICTNRFQLVIYCGEGSSFNCLTNQCDATNICCGPENSTAGVRSVDLPFYPNISGKEVSTKALLDFQSKLQSRLAPRSLLRSVEANETDWAMRYPCYNGLQVAMSDITYLDCVNNKWELVNCPDGQIVTGKEFFVHCGLSSVKPSTQATTVYVDDDNFDDGTNDNKEYGGDDGDGMDDPDYERKLRKLRS